VASLRPWRLKGTYTWPRAALQCTGLLYGPRLSGKAQCKNKGGARYDGELLNGQRHGFGHFTSPDGSIEYKGRFHQNEYAGDGELLLKTGAVSKRYKGQFRAGQLHGQGQMIKQSEKGTMTYKGEWVDGKYEGQGTLEFETGSSYTGNFESGVFEGQGEFHFKSGAVYKGQFGGGKFNGQGVLTEKNGKVTRGEFKDGKPVQSDQP
ncbi:MAG: hypothetical protein KDK39_05465, partial [Leptospiraceae bacterium]|nr:hypothetical protein [Leptospiraceae bacterium]